MCNGPETHGPKTIHKFFRVHAANENLDPNSNTLQTLACQPAILSLSVHELDLG